MEFNRAIISPESYDSQVSIISYHLIHYGTISSMEAINDYGITRLAAVIATLRKRGWAIKSIMESGHNRYGRKTRYARYYFGGINHGTN